MNERVKELMAQAVSFYLDPDSNAYEAQVSPEDLELFAELIVRECADIQMKRSCERHGYDKYEDAKEIKEHFGVTE